ncbi:MAG TPA: hypothetical protein VK923_00005 [Euzebyales bacterium]|nr:hypothetical protein [Euzebyales bacterium]
MGAEDELLELLQITIDELRAHRAAAANATLLHLDHPLPGTESSEPGLARPPRGARPRPPPRRTAIERNVNVGNLQDPHDAHRGGRAWPRRCRCHITPSPRRVEIERGRRDTTRMPRVVTAPFTGRPTCV